MKWNFINFICNPSEWNKKIINRAGDTEWTKKKKMNYSSRINDKRIR